MKGIPSFSQAVFHNSLWGPSKGMSIYSTTHFPGLKSHPGSSGLRETSFFKAIVSVSFLDMGWILMSSIESLLWRMRSITLALRLSCTSNLEVRSQVPLHGAWWWVSSYLLLFYVHSSQILSWDLVSCPPLVPFALYLCMAYSFVSIFQRLLYVRCC